MTTRLIRNAQKRQELVTSEDGHLTQGLQYPSHLPMSHTWNAKKFKKHFLKQVLPLPVGHDVLSLQPHQVDHGNGDRHLRDPIHQLQKRHRRADLSGLTCLTGGQLMILLSEAKWFHRSGLHINGGKKRMCWFIFEGFNDRISSRKYPVWHLPIILQDADKKLNNIMLKVTPKVPLSPTSIRAAHNVTLAAPHQLLSQSEAWKIIFFCLWSFLMLSLEFRDELGFWELVGILLICLLLVFKIRSFFFWIKKWRSLKDSWQGTMIMGADVCHKVAGISVAAVLGSTDFSYVTWPDPLQWEIEKIWKQIVRISYKITQKSC